MITNKTMIEFFKGVIKLVEDGEFDNIIIENIDLILNTSKGKLSINCKDKEEKRRQEMKEVKIDD